MRRIYLFILLLTISLGSYAQQDTFHFSRNTFVVNGTDTSHSFSITDSLYYSGSSNILADTVSFAAKVNSVSLSNTRFVPTPALFTSQDTFFNGQPKSISFTFLSDTTPPFIIGPNVIVIWPIYHLSGFTPGYVGPNDSIHILATTYPLGIPEAPLARVFMYQTTAQLHVQFGEAENLVKQVRISNILGQCIYADSPDRSHTIPTAGWVPGIYLLEITTHSGERRTIKFKLE